MNGPQSLDEIDTTIRRIFAEVLGREIPRNISLDAIGLDSMAMIDISVRVEEIWGIEMPDLDEIGRLKIETMDDFVAIIRERLRS